MPGCAASTMKSSLNSPAARPAAAAPEAASNNNQTAAMMTERTRLMETSPSRWQARPRIVSLQIEGIFVR
jgi:hypothetical protein